MSENKSMLAWVMLGGLALVWGSSFILIKKGLEVYTAGEVGAIRILSAALFLTPVALKNLSSLSKRNWQLLFVVGLCGSTIPAFLFAVAQTHIDSAIAGVLNAITPMFTMIIGFVFFKQKASLMVTLGLLLGFLGSILLIMTGAGGIAQINLYALLVVLATVFYATNLNLIKYFITDLKAEVITSVSLLIVGPAVGIYLLFYTGFVNTLMHAEGAGVALSYLAFLGVIGTAMALIVFNHLVKITSPIFTSSVTYIIPAVAVGWGLVAGEKLLLGHYGGMVLILVGVYLTTKK